MVMAENNAYSMTIIQQTLYNYDSGTIRTGV